MLRRLYLPVVSLKAKHGIEELPATVGSGDIVYLRIDEADPAQWKVVLTAVS